MCCIDHYFIERYLSTLKYFMKTKICNRIKDSVDQLRAYGVTYIQCIVWSYLFSRCAGSIPGSLPTYFCVFLLHIFIVIMKKNFRQNLCINHFKRSDFSSNVARSSFLKSYCSAYIDKILHLLLIRYRLIWSYVSIILVVFRLWKSCSSSYRVTIWETTSAKKRRSYGGQRKY